MYPIQGTEDKTLLDLKERMGDRVSDLSIQEYRSIINSFTGFVHKKISNLEEPYFRIKNFGDYRLSPYELCRHLLKYRNIIKKIESALEEGRRMSIPQKKVDQYYIDEQKFTEFLSIFSRIYGRTYMEKKFKLFKDLNIPEHPEEKINLITNKDHFFDHTKTEFKIYTQEELDKLLK